MVAIGVTSEGQRTILGLDLGCTEDGAHWRAFLRSLLERGLHGVRLVTSDSPLRVWGVTGWVSPQPSPSRTMPWGACHSNDSATGVTDP